MKKLKGVIISFLISIFIINIVEVRPKAEDEGYYIKNMQVDVEVNDKREFFVTETIMFTLMKIDMVLKEI